MLMQWRCMCCQGPEAVGLFDRITGATSAADDPAVAEITDSCGRLPLAQYESLPR